MLTSAGGKLVDFFTSFLYPPACNLCNKLLLEKDLICCDCWNKFNFISEPYCNICGTCFEHDYGGSKNIICGKCIAQPPSYNSARYLFQYNEYSRKPIQAFKYYDQTYLAEIFAKLLYARHREIFENIDLITSVPIHWFKRMMRMYDQAFLLAKELSKLSGIPINNNILFKSKWTKAQTSLNKKSRLKNIKNTIIPNTKISLSNLKILLIDDVFTTGATIEECIKALSGINAAEIHILTIART